MDDSPHGKFIAQTKEGQIGICKANGKGGFLFETEGIQTILRTEEITRLKKIKWKETSDALELFIHAEGSQHFAYLENTSGNLQKINIQTKDLARIIRTIDPSGNKPVRLLSCSDLNAAQSLSRALGKRPLYATEDLVRVHPDGGITTIARSGNSSQQWYKLEGGRKVEVSAPKKPDARYKDDFVQMGKVSLDPKVKTELSRLRIDKAEFLKDYPSIKNAVDANPALVEGWAVLHKSGADEATKLGKFEEMKRFMDSPANKGKSIDDLAREVKDFGGYKEWVKYEKMGGLVRHKIDADLLDELSKIEVNANNLDAIEAIIVKKKTDEIGFLFDKDGKLLAGPLTSQKSEKGVSIPFPDVAKQLETKFRINRDGLKGSTFTHNHPIDGELSNSNYLQIFKNDQTDWTPGTFSWADLDNATKLQQKEIRATTELGHTFILRNADKSKSLPDVHGDVYDLHDGWRNALDGRHTGENSLLYLDDAYDITAKEVESLYQLAKKRANSAGEGLFDLEDFVDHEIWKLVVNTINKQAKKRNKGYQLYYDVLKK